MQFLEPLPKVNSSPCIMNDSDYIPLPFTVQKLWKLTQRKGQVAPKYWRINGERTGGAGEKGGKQVMATVKRVETTQESQFLIQDSGDAACYAKSSSVKTPINHPPHLPRKKRLHMCCFNFQTHCRVGDIASYWAFTSTQYEVAWGTVNATGERSQHSTSLTPLLLRIEIVIF